MVDLRKISLVCMLCFCPVIFGQVIDFEQPDYTAGSGLPSPWVITAGEDAGIISGGLNGSQSLYAKLPNSSEYSCKYPITAPEGDTFSFSITIKPGSFNPGYSDPGVFSLGAVSVTDWHFGYVYFNLTKRIYETYQPYHRQILVNRSDIVAGYFIDGGVYTVTYNIDWTTNTSVITITGDGGVNITRTLQDPAITKSNFQSINLRGSQFWPPWVPTATIFDDFIIGQASEPIAGDINSDGSVNLGDYTTMASCWLTDTNDQNYNPLCNLDDTAGSAGRIDELDLYVLCGSWLAAQ